MVHAFNHSTAEEAGGSEYEAILVYKVSSRSDLHSETLPQKDKNKRQTHKTKPEMRLERWLRVPPVLPEACLVPSTMAPAPAVHKHL